jgi:hypothetical protein
VRRDLKAAYAAETDETIDNAAGEILAAGAALLDASGKVRYMPSVATIAPKLAPKREIRGTHDEAKLERAEQITRAAGPLRKVTTDAREAIKKIPPLPPNATDEQKCARAAAVTNALQNAGIHLEDPDGTDDY